VGTGRSSSGGLAAVDDHGVADATPSSEVGYETMPLPADLGLVLTIYSPEPAGPSADALMLLASWSATNLAAPFDRASVDRASIDDPAGGLSSG
jgi:hypothetical protein